MIPFDFEGKGVLELVAETSSSSPSSNPLVYNKWNKEGCFLGSEPTSVLETIRSPSPSPSPPTSTSTLSSSLVGGGGGGSGGSTDTAGVAAVSGNPSQKWPPLQQETSSSNAGVESGCGSLELQPVPPSVEIGGGSGGGTITAGAEKCGLGMEDWESVLSESVAASPGQEQSIFRWIMGDEEDPSMGLNKLLQTGGGFGVVDQGFGLDPVASGGGNLMATINPSLPTSGFPHATNNEKIGLAPNPSSLPNYKLPNPMFSPLSNNLVPISFSPQPPLPFECSDVKPQIFNPQVLINQHQAQHTQNPSFFLPLSYTQQEQQHLLMPPRPKKHHPGGLEPNCSIPKVPFSDSGQELFMGRPQGLSHQLQLLPHYLPQRPTKPKIVGDEMGQHQLQQQQQQQQQAIIDQLYKAAEQVQTGNSVLAQGILARLNQQLSPIGKPFYRAAFYCKEALQLLIHTNNNNNNNMTPTAPHSSPFSLIFKIGAYKSFSEISPFLQFANFTCNQALLEVLEGFDRIHIIDFDIGYGGQWASFMQELALKSGGAPSLKITAFASPSTHDQIELGLTRENLNHFASEINMAFEFEILSLDSLNSASWSLPLHVSENEAIAVNLPVCSFSNYQLSLPLVLRFVKQLSPKIVVSVDRGCDWIDVPFPNHVIHALQSYSNLLESLDAVNVNLDALQKIERFLLQPGIEKIVMGRYRSPEKMPHWRTLFLSSGFSPLTFSNFTESQAECVVKRTPVRGFHVEKRQSSLVLCWQQKELISASAWRC
uniref:Putative scarecrow-like protein 27 n=1 Tax=Davidia involucrata TaxID=16924 RepID=A0A5B7AH46_DAVIN